MNFWSSLEKPILALAPMEGVTDTAFRQIAKTWGADVVYTEFTAAEAIFHRARRAMERLEFNPSERPVIAQIFGREPEAFVQAVKLIGQMGFAGLDINFGCPARKVVAKGAGVALLRDPQYARRLVGLALENTTLPVSMKIRTSIRKERQSLDANQADVHTAVDFIAALHGLPVAAVMVHGRSYEQGHHGEVDAAMIRQVKKHFHGPVLANGGIFTPERVPQMLSETMADGVGIARGAWGQPWIFQQTKRLLKAGGYESVDWRNLKQTIIDHARLVVKTRGERGLIEFRKHLAKYVSGFPRASEFRNQAVRINTLADVDELIKNIEKQTAVSESD
ncbi:MAG: tRNA-dihydrouridine synthase [Candidatus Kerfeldbacteria bacterium]|nr:tRNA-dihydrouridine synthase [Candidatus Kerfeldbacteria bacterium]